jgi:virginiamycin A acetyltransferase
VKPYSVVVGNPAVEVKKRFDEQTIDKLLKIKWLNWKFERIEKICPSYSQTKSQNL